MKIISVPEAKERLTGKYNNYVLRNMLMFLDEVLEAENYTEKKLLRRIKYIIGSIYK